MKLARQVIESIEGELNLADYTDEYQQGLRALIDAKVAGEEVAMPAESAPPKVVDLMEALRKSLEQVSGGKKKSAKVAEGRHYGQKTKGVLMKKTTRHKAVWGGYRPSSMPRTPRPPAAGS